MEKIYFIKNSVSLLEIIVRLKEETIQKNHSNAPKK